MAAHEPAITRSRTIATAITTPSIRSPNQRQANVTDDDGEQRTVRQPDRDFLKDKPGRPARPEIQHGDRSHCHGRTQSDAATLLFFFC